jgi:NitT/TauT family transport system ATP-binding protein
VKENITFALGSTERFSRSEADERALHYIRKVNLSEFANSYPHTLSGGMKQRAAIARAMALEPQVLLMDEPFAALDALTRSNLQEELLQLWDEMKFTMLFVTHSIPEAIRLGNRILLLSVRPGQVKAEINSQGADAARIEQILFDRPIGERGPHE